MAENEDRIRQKRPRFDSLEQELFLNLWRTYDALKALEDEMFGRFDITAQQYNALRILLAAHPARVPTLALASRLVSRAPDITRLLDKLCERGLIERHRVEQDRRAVHIGLTDAGLSLLEELAGHVRDCHKRQVGHLRPEEIEQLSTLLRRAREPHEPPESGWR